MKALVTIVILITAVTALKGQPVSDSRCARMAGIAVEGHIDSLRRQLNDAGFADWGNSDDGEDYYFRGAYYGIRSKLMVTLRPLTKLVSQAYVTVGPYRTGKMLQRNFAYFKYKIEQEVGELYEHDGAYYYMDDYGSIKLSVGSEPDGSKEIRVLYLTTAPFYKDALSRGLHGDVQEIVTENPLAENPVERYLPDGQADDAALKSRRYNRYGYLLSAEIDEDDGCSTVTFEYDSRQRLSKRTLDNITAGVRYVNEYVYNDDDELTEERQKIFDKDNQCIMTLNMRNEIMERDEHGNWTVNSLTLTYWEKGRHTQKSTAIQRRNISYWNIEE